MVTDETSYDSVVLTKAPESYKVCQMTVTNEMSYDSVVLTKDTGVIQRLLVDGDI